MEIDFHFQIGNMNFISAAPFTDNIISNSTNFTIHLQAYNYNLPLKGKTGFRYRGILFIPTNFALNNVAKLSGFTAVLLPYNTFTVLKLYKQ